MHLDFDLDLVSSRLVPTRLVVVASNALNLQLPPYTCAFMKGAERRDTTRPERAARLVNAPLDKRIFAIS